MTATEPRRWTADDVLEALRRKHNRAALVPEITIVDAYPSNVHWVGERPIYTRRIDALMFETRIRTAIEIKVTRADAKRETFRKVRPWRQVTHRFVYAVPAGLIDRPPVGGCGLWWVHADGRIEVRAKAVINRTPEPLPQQVVQALAYRGRRGGDAGMTATRADGRPRRPSGIRLRNRTDPAVIDALTRVCPNCGAARGQWCVAASRSPSAGRRLSRIHYARCTFKEG